MAPRRLAANARFEAETSRKRLANTRLAKKTGAKASTIATTKRGTTASEKMREAQCKATVGKKDRGESKHDRNDEAGNNRQREEKLRLHEPGDHERDQQRQVQAPGRPQVNPPRDLNRQVHGEQDPNEDK